MGFSIYHIIRVIITMTKLATSPLSITTRHVCLFSFVNQGVIAGILTYHKIIVRIIMSFPIVVVDDYMKRENFANNVFNYKILLRYITLLIPSRVTWHSNHYIALLYNSSSFPRSRLFTFADMMSI